MHTFLDTDRAISFLEAAEEFVWEFREVPVVTPFSFGIYVSRIKEGMMMEDPDQAIERLFSEMHQRFSSANPQ
ncbi:MAG: hypothetical protein AAF191_19155 [Verrucomicrobiota bacterium]